MKRPIRIAVQLAALVLAGVIGYTMARWTPQTGEGPSANGAQAPVEQVYTCSMHPQVRTSNPGDCPICEMPLIPASAVPAGGDVAPELRLSEHARAMASVETTLAVRKELDLDLRVVGSVQVNEAALASVTARVDGYAERLFVNVTGVNIQAGDHLADIYSPELLVAQQELLIALQGDPTGPLVETTRLKLLRWGMTAQQIDSLIETRTITDRVTLFSPITGTVIEKNLLENSAFQTGDMLFRIVNLDTVWVYLDIYEYDLAWVRYGQQVELRAEAYPGQVFTGQVTFVEPTLNEQTRTIRVPVHVDNHDHRLKPGMYVSATIKSRLGPNGQAAPTGVEGKYTCRMHPQVLEDTEGPCPLCEMPLERIPGVAPVEADQDDDHDHDHDETVDGEPQYYCPMLCEDDKTYPEPGNCPVCNMRLVEQDDAPRTETRYYCTMLCEDDKTYAEPGNCPVCNMRLEPIEVPDPRDLGPATGLLVVPISAVLDSGTRTLVYVEKTPGLFEPREVTLGPRSGALYPVLEGLTAGERVVTRGGFLIDSQFQVTGHSSLFYPGGLHADPAGRDGHGPDHNDRATSPETTTHNPNQAPREPAASVGGAHQH